MKSVQPIGSVTMEYAETGKVIRGEFKPMMVIELDDALFTQLEALPQGEDASILQSNADLILAAWFSKSNEIELADREKWEIVSSVADCSKYPTGKVRKCVIEYTFKKRA